MNAYYSLVTKRGLAMLVVPVAALIIAIFTHNVLILDYVHVLTGGAWTGIDIFMGFVFSYVMKGNTREVRAAVARRLTPLTMFFLPALATTAITSGIYLAQSEGIFSLHSPLIIASGIIVLILVVQGFGIFLPAEIRVFVELGKERPDTSLISRLMMRVLKLGGVQGIFQMLIILVMALIAI